MRCPACGASYEGDARFCTRDGRHLVRGAAEQPQARAADTPVAEAPPPPRHAARPQRASSAGERSELRELEQLVGRTLGGRYRIEHKAGEGGMAFVFRAADLQSGSPVAVKVLTPMFARDQTSLARLRREAEIGSRLIHPNICHIISLGESDGLVYIIMPFVEGELLCDRTFRLGQLPVAEVARIASDVAAGLHAAHALKVVHRDLKPENVMLCRGADGIERAVVLDFGLAKQRPADEEVRKLTATGIVVGTPEFMSPEQIRGRPVDARTDVYALGVMAYEMLTGKLPFEGSSQQEIMVARLRGEPIPLRKRRPDLRFRAEVERVLARCMAADPAARYPSAAAFAEALSGAAAGGGTVSMVLERLFRG